MDTSVSFLSVSYFKHIANARHILNIRDGEQVVGWTRNEMNKKKSDSMLKAKTQLRVWLMISSATIN